MVDDNKHNQLPERSSDKNEISDEKNSQSKQVSSLNSDETHVDNVTKSVNLEKKDDDHVPDGYFLPESGSKDDFDSDMPPSLLEFHSPTSAVINMPPTASAQYMTWLVAGLALFSVIGMCVFPLDKVVSASGRLVSIDPPLLVQPIEQGILRSIKVQEGDFVTKGQVLAELDPTITDADFDALKVQVDSGKAEIDRLQAEANDRDYVVDPSNPYSIDQAKTFLKRKLEYNAKIAGYDQKIKEQQAELKNYQATVAVLRGRVKVAADVHNMRQQLQKEEVGSKLSTLGAQDTLMEVENKLITAQQTLDATLKKIAGVQEDKTAYIENWKGSIYKDLTLAQRQYAKDEGDYTKTKLRRGKVELRAEQNALVLTIAKGSIGSVLNAGVPFMTLIPVGKGLEVEAAIDGEQVGYLKLGDKAIVKFNTFPYAQYGGAEAVVTNISADVFQPADALQENNRRGGPPMEFREKPFFRVQMKINKYTLHGTPNFFHPTPGLTVSADIHVGKRTVAQYLMNGIVPQLSQGMRDPQ